MNDYLSKIIVPYVVKKRSELKLDEDHPALVIFDNFTAQCTEQFFKQIESHHITNALVPANYGVIVNLKRLSLIIICIQDNMFTTMHKTGACDLL